jgi:uncharacterized phage-associated protein
MTPLSTQVTAFDVAHWFLAKANSENKPLKHMKLQKLVYFAYGWYYAYCDEPLFGEEIYAWRHGPVVSELYHQYKHYKHKPMTEDAKPPDLNKNVVAVLDSVWGTYASYTDVHLSEITHRPDSPWTHAYRSDEWYATMSPESIRVYFKALRQKHDHAQS